MGNSQYQSTKKFSSYSQIQTLRVDWCGETKKISSGIKKDNQIFKKTIYLASHQQAKAFIKEYYKTQTPQFYLRHPLGVQLDDSDQICSLSQNIHIYHDKFYPTLSNKVALEKSHSFKQCRIWFILSEVVHALDILYERGHPHLWISPDTIYYNINQNWFLEDMHYWQGPNYESFFKSKLYSQTIISKSIKGILQNNQVIDLQNAKDQDIYCLGYCIIYMMTGIYPYQARNNVNMMIQRCQLGYSRKLLNLTKSMIQQNSDQRITLQKLRYRLKIDQQAIIAKEVEDFQAQQQHKRMSIDNEISYKNQKSDPLKTPIKPIFNLQNPYNNSSWERKTYEQKNVGKVRLSEEQSTQSIKRRLYYSPVHPIKKRTSEFNLNSPRF